MQAVKASGKMRFNRAELAALAAQPSHKFEKEGVLFVRERQDGFFRKSESKTPCVVVSYLLAWFHLLPSILYHIKERKKRVHEGFARYSLFVKANV